MDTILKVVLPSFHSASSLSEMGEVSQRETLASRMLVLVSFSSFAKSG